MILSGVTAQPGLCAGFLVVSEARRDRFARALRFHAGSIPVVVGSTPSHIIAILRTPDLDEAEAAIMRAVYEVAHRDFPPDDFPRTPAKWPSLLKKISK
jgi:hypothetical protein